MIGLFKGLHATISHLLTRKDTIQYPEARREPPERSRGLIRMRLLPETFEPRCAACTFCEQVCPATAINVIYQGAQPPKVWTLDAGAGPMLCNIGSGEAADGGNGWAGNGGAGAPTRACLAASLIDAEELTASVLERTTRRDGVLLSTAYGVATFYDQLGPGTPGREIEAPTPTEGSIAEGCPPILLGNHGSLDPESIDDYSQKGGYLSVTRTLTEMTPEQTLAEINSSGLRGRGGGGYEVAAKWREAHEAVALRKFLICNAVEGDRNSYKDRSLLENNPHAVIEGMMLAGYAIGARKGIIYLCSDYALAAERIRKAIDQATGKGILGEELPGTGFGFSVELVTIPRAYISGEETALIATLQSQRPMPQMRPPYPSQKGLRGLPTVVENAETLASVPWIINNGGDAYHAIGSTITPGTKLFTLSGAVAAPGLYEATLDFSLKKLVTETAGGFDGDPQGALVGGAGGGLLSPGLFDIPLDFESIAETGGGLNTGSIVVLGGKDCVVSTVRQCIDFSANESCGKCTPCRLGLSRLNDIAARICMGNGNPGDLDLAEELARYIADSAFCRHGRDGVRPLLTGLNFFRDEFIRHVEEGRCDAGKCNM